MGYAQNCWWIPFTASASICPVNMQFCGGPRAWTKGCWSAAMWVDLVEVWAGRPRGSSTNCRAGSGPLYKAGEILEDSNVDATVVELDCCPRMGFCRTAPSWPDRKDRVNRAKRTGRDPRL